MLHHAHRQGDVQFEEGPLEDVLHRIDAASVDTSRAIPRRRDAADAAARESTHIVRVDRVDGVDTMPRRLDAVVMITRESRASRAQVPEYEAWKDAIGSNASKFSVKYYKGLGTSTAAEARDYFSDLATHQLDFDLLREGDGDLVDMAFSKKRVEDRKTWLRSLEPGAFVDYGVDALAYKDFVRSRRPVV